MTAPQVKEKEIGGVTIITAPGGSGMSDSNAPVEETPPSPIENKVNLSG